MKKTSKNLRLCKTVVQQGCAATKIACFAQDHTAPRNPPFAPLF